MFTITWLFIAFACGYCASIYTWSRVRTYINGLETEAQDLRRRAIALERKLRGASDQA